MNSLNNLTPLLALGWLGLFSTVTLVRVDWFVLGALVIITANTLLQIRQSRDSTSAATATL